MGITADKISRRRLLEMTKHDPKNIYVISTEGRNLLTVFYDNMKII